MLGCNREGLNRLISTVKVGGTVIFPTEASYVMTEGDALLFMDKREAIEMVSREPLAFALAERFWPGPLLLRVRASDGFLTLTVPSDEKVRKILEVLGGRLKVRVLNSPTLRDALKSSGKVDVALDCGTVPFPEGYTLVKVEGYSSRLISEGAIPVDTLERVMEGVVG